MIVSNRCKKHKPCSEYKSETIGIFDLCKECEKKLGLLIKKFINEGDI